MVAAFTRLVYEEEYNMEIRKQSALKLCLTDICAFAAKIRTIVHEPKPPTATLSTGLSVVKLN